MAIYLKKFENHTQYDTYINGSSAILPNVSICTTEGDVHYNPSTPPTPVETRVAAKYNVTSTSSPTRIGFRTSGFSTIEIDGVVQPSVVSAYTFSTTGEHTVKYTLIDPTSIGNSTFYGCSSVTNIDIPDSVTSIGNEAFYYCSGLTSIDIPDSVTSIGKSAFANCTGLTSCTIGSGVTIIGDGAFYCCRSLTNITVDSDNVNYSSDEGVLFNKAKTTLICVPIGNSRTSYNIPNSVTSISSYAFRYCSGLTSIDIPNSVTSIGNEAFTNCSGLTSINIPSGVTSIGINVFYCCTSLTTVTIPDSVTSIGNNAFQYCYSLTSITIPSGVTWIGYDAFSNCESLTSITIPSGVTWIGEGAFYGCSSLTSIEIPSGVTSIGDYAFGNCYSLTSIYVLPSDPPELGSDVFYETNDCPIYVSDVEAYALADGWSEYADRLQ